MIQQLFKIEWEGSTLLVFEYHEISLECCVKKLPDHKNIMSQLVSAIEYLQSSRIVLINLNPSNMFIIEKNNAKLVVKITNFTHAIELEGESVKINKNLKKKYRDLAAPEVTWSHQKSPKCIFYYIFSGGWNINGIKFKSHLNILQTKETAAVNYIDVLCADLIQKLVLYKQADRPSVMEIKNHPFFWSPQEITAFFIEVCKISETATSGNQFRKALYRNSNTILGEENDWTVKVDSDVMQDLQKLRSDYQARTSTDAERTTKKSILSLVRVMRNIIVHAQTPSIEKHMGSPEKFVNYWLSRFPGLLLHVYNAKISLKSQSS